MSTAYGMDAGIGISFQNSFGTALTASMHWLEPISESVDVKIQQIVQKGMRGIYDDGAVSEGSRTVEGDISIEAKAIPMGVLLAAVMGRTTVTSAGVYTHTFKPRTADFDLLSAERPFTYHKHLGDTGSAHLYADMNGNSLEIAISNGELMTCKLGMVGGTYSQIAEIAASYPTGSPMAWDITSASLGGTANTDFRSVTITLNNNLEAKQTLRAGKYPTRVKRSGMRSVEVAGTLVFNTQAVLQDFLAQTEQRFFLNMRTTTEIQSGYFESLRIDIPSLRFLEHPIPVGGAGELEVSFKAKAVYNVGSANALTITLVNSKAGY